MRGMTVDSRHHRQSIHALFQADKYNDRKAPAYWLKFQFPFWWTGLLTALDTLSRLGFDCRDEDVARGLDWFLIHSLMCWICPSVRSWIPRSLGETLVRTLRVSNHKLKAESDWRPIYPSMREGWKGDPGKWGRSRLTVLTRRMRPAFVATECGARGRLRSYSRQAFQKLGEIARAREHGPVAGGQL
jgi:hypothetical protein